MAASTRTQKIILQQIEDYKASQEKSKQASSLASAEQQPANQAQQSHSQLAPQSQAQTESQPSPQQQQQQQQDGTNHSHAQQTSSGPGQHPISFQTSLHGKPSPSGSPKHAGFSRPGSGVPAQAPASKEPSQVHQGVVKASSAPSTDSSRVLPIAAAPGPKLGMMQRPGPQNLQHNGGAINASPAVPSTELTTDAAGMAASMPASQPQPSCSQQQQQRQPGQVQPLRPESVQVAQLPGLSGNAASGSQPAASQAKAADPAVALRALKEPVHAAGIHSRLAKVVNWYSEGYDCSDAIWACICLLKSRQS